MLNEEYIEYVKCMNKYYAPIFEFGELYRVENIESPNNKKYITSQSNKNRYYLSYLLNSESYKAVYFDSRSILDEIKI